MNTLDLPRRVGVVSKFLQRRKKKDWIDRILEPVFVGGERVGNDILWKIECRGSEKENLGKLNRSF